MRVVLEHLRRLILRLRTDHRVASQVVPDVLDAVLGNALGLSERAPVLDNRLLVVDAPFHPGIHARLLVGLALLGGGQLLLEGLESGRGPRINRHVSLHCLSSFNESLHVRTMPASLRSHFFTEPCQRVGSVSSSRRT